MKETVITTLLKIIRVSDMLASLRQAKLVELDRVAAWLLLELGSIRRLDRRWAHLHRSGRRGVGLRRLGSDGLWLAAGVKLWPSLGLGRRARRRGGGPAGAAHRVGHLAAEQP